MSVPGGVSTVCELACTGQGGEALPSPLRDPLFLTCPRAVSPRPAFGVCRLTAATPHLVLGAIAGGEFACERLSTLLVGLPRDP